MSQILLQPPLYLFNSTCKLSPNESKKSLRELLMSTSLFMTKVRIGNLPNLMVHRSLLSSWKCNTIPIDTRIFQSNVDIHSHYKGSAHKDEQPLAFVGKGITFDSGGISLKSGAVSIFFFRLPITELIFT